MDWKALVILTVVNILYILIGGAVFHALESNNEDTTKTTINQEYVDFLATQTCVTTEELRTFVLKVLAAYDAGVFSTDTESSASLWDYGNSVFFSMTAVTTIGYGNQTPVTSGGRAFVCIFAIIGIPLMALLLSGYGEKIQKLIKPLEDRVWVKDHPKIDRTLKTATLILIGLIAFFIIPAGIFSAIEGWTFGEGFYYTIITLTTVGFGDFVIGTSDSGYRIGYRLCSGIWLVLGLSWVALLIGNLQNSYNEFIKKREKKKETEEDKADVEKDEKEMKNVVEEAGRKSSVEKT